jgi:hypothetical protein
MNFVVHTVYDSEIYWYAPWVVRQGILQNFGRETYYESAPGRPERASS